MGSCRKCFYGNTCNWTCHNPSETTLVGGKDLPIGTEEQHCKDGFTERGEK